MSERVFMPGDVLAGRYRLTTIIGAGGMGVVYGGTQISLNRPVAIKLMHARFRNTAGAQKRFEREARVSSRLRHPNAIEVYDFGEDDGYLYLVMEWLRGQSLREALEDRGDLLPLARALDIGERVADVLVAAHAENLVHRDLKPENVFLAEGSDGVVRPVVLDFGLAFIADGDEAHDRMTREGIVTGTPDYLSPEQARGSVNLGPATDVYALGCMLFELFAGDTPFQAPDPAMLLAKHLFAQAPTLAEACPERKFPSALEELVHRMLAKEADRRPTALSVREALASIDPAAPERFGKGLQEGRALGRAARMISQPPRAADAVEIPTVTSLAAVTIVGELDDDARLALRANGFDATPTTSECAVGLVLALGQSESDLAALVAGGATVVADAEASDMQRLSRLLRAGVADVLIKPFNGATAAKKLRRAATRGASS